MTYFVLAGSIQSGLKSQQSSRMIINALTCAFCQSWYIQYEKTRWASARSGQVCYHRPIDGHLQPNPAATRGLKWFIRLVIPWGEA